MTIHIFSLGFGRGVFAVLKRGVDHAAFKRVHGFKLDLSARAVRLVCKAVCKGFQRFDAFFSVVFGVDRHADKVVSAFVDKNERKILYRVKHFAAVSDNDAAVASRDIDDDFFVFDFTVGIASQIHSFKQAVQKVDDNVRGCFLSLDGYDRLAEKTAFLQNFYFGVFSFDAEFFQAFLDGFFDRGRFDFDFFHMDSLLFEGRFKTFFFVSLVVDLYARIVNKLENGAEQVAYYHIYRERRAVQKGEHRKHNGHKPLHHFHICLHCVLHIFAAAVSRRGLGRLGLFHKFGGRESDKSGDYGQ